jgi:hypothetical protein
LGFGSPSVNIYGDTSLTGLLAFYPTNETINTNLSASYIYVSGSTNDLYFSQNGAGYNNNVRLRWLEGNLYTGLLSGGQLSSSIGSTTFSISSGSGVVVNLNASLSQDPYPIVKYFSWGNFNNVPITYSGSAQITYVGIDSGSNIVQQTIPWGSNLTSQFDNQIQLGVVLTLSGSVSTGVYNSPQVAYGLQQQNDDFIRAFGPVKISGHTLQASGSGTVRITKTGGTSFRFGSNYYTDPNHPSTVVESLASYPSKIYRYYSSASTFVIDTGVNTAGYAVLDPTQYNNNGVLTAVPGNGANRQFSIQRIFWFPNSPTKAFIAYYGNATYTSLVNAVNAIPSEEFSEAPNTAANAILLGYVIMINNCSDLTNSSQATIVPGGLFRSISGVGASGAAPVSTTLASLSDVAISGPSQGDLLVYGSGTQWNNTKILNGSYSITGNLTVTGSIIGTATSASYLSGSNTAYVSALSASNVYVDGGTVTAGTFTTPNVKINNDIIVTGSLTVLSTASFLSQSSFILNTSDPFYLANNPTIVLSNSPNNTLGIKGALIVGPNGTGTNWCRLNNDGTSDFGGGQIHFNNNGSGYFNGNIGIGNLTYSTTNTLNVYGNVFANSYTGSLSGSVTGNLLGTASYSNSSSYLSGNVAKIIPVSDATVDLGSISNRFNGLYAVQSTIGAFFEVGLRTIGIGQNPTGTIVTWRNGKLVPSDTEEDSLVMGVVWQGKDEPIIIGAETILVTGKVEEGDYIVTSNKIGHGKAIKRGNFFKNDLFGKVIAQALESSNEDSKLIKAMIRKM